MPRPSIMKTEIHERGKKLSNIPEQQSPYARSQAAFSQPEKRFPVAIVCHSAKKNSGEHKAILLRERPSGFNE
jgi:hypothetical protein